MVAPAIIAAGISAGGSLLGGLLGSQSSGGGLPKNKWYKQNVKDLYAQAQDIASQPFEFYNDPRFADFSPDQLAGMDLVRGNLGLGSSAVNSALGRALQTYTPQSVSATGVNATDVTAPAVNVNYNPNQIQAQLLSGGFNYTPQSVGTSNVTADKIASQNFTDYDINQYLNPFISSVVDTSLSDIERQRERTENAQKADMAAAGAWGGSRSGVAQALTNEAYGNTAAQTAASLRSRGFDQAANLISMDANRNLSASQSNQNAALQASITNASLGLQASLAEQAAALDAAKFGANLGLQQGLANQGADLQSQLANLSSSQFGANLGLNASLANQDAAMRAALANQSAGLQAQFQNQQSALQAAIANQAAGLSANQQGLYGAQLAGNLGALQQSMGNTDAQNLLSIGALQQAQAQAPLDFAYQQYLMNQGWDQQQLSWLQGFLQHPSGSVGVQPSQNSGLGILGGALTGGQLASNIYNAWNQPAQPAPSPYGPYSGGYQFPGAAPVTPSIDLSSYYFGGGGQ